MFRPRAIPRPGRAAANERPPRVLAHLPDAGTQATLLAATLGDTPGPPRDRIEFCDDWARLLGKAATTLPELVIAGDPGEGRTQHMRRLLPKAGIILWLPPGPQQVLSVALKVAPLVDGYVVPGENDDPHSVAELIGEARTERIWRQVIPSLAQTLSADGLRCVGTLLRLTRRPLSVRAASEALFASPETVRRRLRACGLPPLNALIVWCRLLHAASFLENPSRSVENVAYVLDFPSRRALANHFRRYIGRSPKEVRTQGGVGAVLRAFESRSSPPEGDPSWGDIVA